MSAVTEEDHKRLISKAASIIKKKGLAITAEIASGLFQMSGSFECVGEDFVKYGYGELVHRFMTHTNVINGQIQYTILDKDSTKSGKDQRQQKSRVMLSNRPFEIKEIVECDNLFDAVQNLPDDSKSELKVQKGHVVLVDCANVQSSSIRTEEKKSKKRKRKETTVDAVKNKENIPSPTPSMRAVTNTTANTDTSNRPEPPDGHIDYNSAFPHLNNNDVRQIPIHEWM